MQSQEVTAVQIAEILGSINNLATKLDHYADTMQSTHNETIKRVDKIEERHEKVSDRLAAVEKQMPLIEDMRTHSRDAKRVVYGVAGTILTVAIIGGILFAKTGGA